MVDLNNLNLSHIIFLERYPEYFDILKSTSEGQGILDSLEVNGYIKILNEKYLLREEGKALIKETGITIKVNKADKLKQVKDLAITLINIFPKGVKTAGHYVRDNKVDVEKALVRFYTIYDYPKEILIKATEAYVKEKERDSYKFMLTLGSFIHNADKGSKLATYCDNLNIKLDTDDWTKNSV